VPPLFLAAAGKVATLILTKSPLSPAALRALEDAAKANEFTVLLSQVVGQLLPSELLPAQIDKNRASGQAEHGDTEWREIVMGRTPQAELFAKGYRPMAYHPDGGGSGGGGGGGNGVAQTVKALHSGGGQRWWRRHAGQPQ
jgi:hypothetical protein